MQYKSFRIRNFKGIKDTVVDLKNIAGANVFAFVGLNESGKTTILEAIHSFSPDDATSELLAGEKGIGIPFRDRVPRHLLSEFTGDVSVKATILITDKDKEEICQEIETKAGLILDASILSNELVFERQQRFENGDFKVNYFSIRNEIQVKKSKGRKWRDPNPEESIAIRDIIHALTPNIAYFPTFVFNFPKSIYLTDRGGSVDKFYRRVFQDILDFEGRGQTIEKDIVRRIRGDGMVVPWLSFLSQWSKHSDKEKIQHVLDRAGAAVTGLIFGRWNKIFGEDARGKEIVISLDVVEGKTMDEAGSEIIPKEHDAVIKFQIRDGTRRFDVNDRSLGFRWFFSFMLFTQLRGARSGSNARPLLFLFDEPASNLHAAAQQKLIDSFPEIARNEHILAYSTHSHYMIEPKWLEQTFIVTNRADAPMSSVLDGVSLDDESLDVKVSTYRSFLNKHPNNTSYFQPILDRLEVVPSRFDFQKSSIILEGKSDYFILRYAMKLHSRTNLAMLPGLGAGTFGALAAMHAGWNLDFLFVLDGDVQGKLELRRYVTEYGISADRFVTLDNILPGTKTIEDMLDLEARKIIKEELKLDNNPTKDQIRRFFQERLASNNITELGPEFARRTEAILAGLEVRIRAN